MCGICLTGTHPAAAGGGIVAGTLAAAPREDEIGEALSLIEAFPSVDLHSHPGRFFMVGGPATPLSRLLPPAVDERLADLAASPVTAAFFALVSDQLVLEPSPTGLRATRDYRPGEVYDDYRRQLRTLDAISTRAGLVPADDVVAIQSAFAAKRTARLLSVEGGDFIEHRLERIAEAASDGVRSITIIHYRTNQFGDTQTEPATHGGLTGFGRTAIAEMERHRIIVDLSHASDAAARQAVACSTRPVTLSHSNIRFAGQSHPRLVSPEIATMVAGTGGVVGVVPAGFDQSTLDDYADTIARMTDLLGADHVAIGTDMDFTFNPVLIAYRQWTPLVVALRRRGFDRATLRAVLGGNVLRLLAQVTPTSH